MSHLFKGLLFIITTIIMSSVFLMSGLVQGQSQETIVHVEAMDHAFDVDAPKELASGWITFILSNQMAGEMHEISLVELPDGVTHEDYLTDYMIGWETVLGEYQEGVIERSGISARANELLPAWSDGLRYISSRGLASPGKTAERTVYLEPGEYLLVCWLKTEDGIIHIMRGMHWEFTVKGDASGSPLPKPESQITLHQNEIELDWEPVTGKHSFEVGLSKNSNGRSYHNNLHLVRLEEGTDLDEVSEWMDWYKIGGLKSPSPVEFLGGIEVERVADTAYFSLNITEPGDYAWVVFVPQGQGLYKTFTVE